jgi:hypothetical protein
MLEIYVKKTVQNSGKILNDRFSAGQKKIKKLGFSHYFHHAF